MDKKTGRIICTKVGKGRRHDFHLFKQSKLAIQEDTIALADSGYQGIQKIHPKPQVPKRNSKKKPLSKVEKKQNSMINTNRVIVENTIRKIKTFKLMAEKYRNRRKRFTLRLNLITAIINFEL